MHRESSCCATKNLPQSSRNIAPFSVFFNSAVGARKKKSLAEEKNTPIAKQRPPDRYPFSNILFPLFRGILQSQKRNARLVASPVISNFTGNHQQCRFNRRRSFQLPTRRTCNSRQRHAEKYRDKRRRQKKKRRMRGEDVAVADERNGAWPRAARIIPRIRGARAPRPLLAARIATRVDWRDKSANVISAGRLRRRRSSASSSSGRVTVRKVCRAHTLLQPSAR